MSQICSMHASHFPQADISDVRTYIMFRMALLDQNALNCVCEGVLRQSKQKMCRKPTKILLCSPEQHQKAHYTQYDTKCMLLHFRCRSAGGQK